MTVCLSVIVFPTGDEFQWGEVGEGLVGACAVVGMLPVAQPVTVARWLVVVRVYLVELFMVSTVRAFEFGIQSRGFGGSTNSGSYFC